MSTQKTFTVDAPGAVLTYDVHVPDGPSDRRPLFVLASPMAASDFGQLVGHLGDRTVLTYDPRGMERSTLSPDGKVSVPIHADDFHRVVQAARDVIGEGPVDVFASSGGAVNVLAWVVDHPDELGTVVAHEPPLWTLLEDSDVQRKVAADIVETYQRDGFGPAMAKFIQLVMQPGPLTEDYLRQPAPDPAAFGLPTEDDGSRDDLLLGWNMATLPHFEPDLDALRATSVRLVPAHGEAGEGEMARRGAEALAAALGVEPAVFPGDHGGFMANEWSPGNDPAAFAARLKEVLAG
ncbi:alpha/beta fold hydrolase [Isoptericola cucumis]|uniref:Hydrolase n=1 Tax=Isoptericola cucumis TaxID=1776856 RepID=A0ABQ2B6E8_9MICO|nr:alpha/beta hydrolase [Isoptericola cucumis]GGI09188.1 hydrolase [Isoptericola cucumis]